MPILADYHLHSPFSSDSTKMEVADIFKFAIKNKLKEVCITDHRDIKTPALNPDGYEPNHNELHKIVNELQPKYPDVVVKVGCEYSLHKNNADEIAKTITEHNLNFVIASTHANEKVGFAAEIIKTPDNHVQIHLDYLTCMYESLQNTSAYSVLGHFDVIERYNMNARLDLNKHRDLIYEILKTLANNGKGLEINTAFIYLKSEYPHPRLDILKMFKEVGGEVITVGSDSHNNEPLGYQFDIVPDYLRSAGFEHYCTFSGYNNPTFHHIDSYTL